MRRAHRSTNLDEREFLAEVRPEMFGKKSMLGLTKGSIAVDESEGVGSRNVKEMSVGEYVGDFELRDTALPGTEKVTGTSELQVYLGDLETVCGRHHGSEPLLRETVADPPRGYRLSRPDALPARVAIHFLVNRMQYDWSLPLPTLPPELVQLGKTEPLGVLNDHDRGIRDVDTHLDDRGRHQNIQLFSHKSPHNPVLLVAGEPAMDQPETQNPGTPAAADILRGTSPPSGPMTRTPR